MAKENAKEKKAQRGATDNVYHAEEETHRHAETVLSKKTIDKSALREAFQTLSAAYKRLLRQAEKITRISDTTQSRLRKTQDDLSLALKSAEEANAFKTELLSIAAHDLKNPLQTILGFASLIVERPDEADEVKDLAQHILRSSERMANLITELLQSTAIDAGNFILDQEPHNLSELARQVIFANRTQAARKSQTITLNAPERAVAPIDYNRIREVLDNLISNAIKYSPKNTAITVEIENRAAASDAAPASSSVLISVKDEGQGLTEKDKEKLFGKFQRLSARPTGGESSTGLGLSIVKQLVELHGGKVWAESEGKGKGTTFFIELPSVNIHTVLANE
jgi:signal transduction histidine kinase